MLDAGDVKHQGAENSALKNNAPLSLTPLRISENASIRPSGRPAKFSGRSAKQSAPANVRAIHRDAAGMVVAPSALHNCKRPRRDVKRVKRYQGETQ